MVAEQPIHADWFSGVIRIPKDELLQYIHMGFGSVYEEELHVKITKGVVVKSKKVDNKGTEVGRNQLTQDNVPGSENRIPGDDL